MADRTPVQEAETFLRLLLMPGSVAELRAVDVRSGYGGPHIESGYFDYDHIAEMARAAVKITDRAAGTYTTINPIDQSLLARRYLKLDRAGQGETTGDTHIVGRRTIFFDADAIRDAKISATDEEKAESLKTVNSLRDFLTSKKWPEPIFADSGNGYHLIYRIELPVADDEIVKRILFSVAARFDNARVKIDKSVFNPSRICKIPGTLARKGDSVPSLNRIHRRARLIEYPETLREVPIDLLRQLADEMPPAEKKTSSTTSARPSGFTSKLAVGKWLEDNRQGYSIKPGTSQGWTVYVLSQCPFNAEHTKKDSAIFQAPDGKMGAKCFHNSCAGKGWQAFKEAIGKPEHHHYDPPIVPGQVVRDEDDLGRLEDIFPELADESPRREPRPTPKVIASTPVSELVINRSAQPPMMKLIPFVKSARAARLFDRKAGLSSPFEYDKALTIEALTAGWTDQEICDLLLATAARFSDPPQDAEYYANILSDRRSVTAIADQQREIKQQQEEAKIEKAKQQEAEKKEAEDIFKMASALKDETEESRRIERKQELLDALSDALVTVSKQSIRFVQFIRWCPADPEVEFEVVTNMGPVMLGKASAIIDQRTFISKIAGVTKIKIKEKKARGAWDKISQAILSCCDDLFAGIEAYDETTISMWIEKFIYHTQKSASAQGLLTDGIQHREDGKILLVLEFLRTWVRTRYSVDWSAIRWGRALRSVHVFSDKIKVNGHNVHVWIINDDSILNVKNISDQGVEG